MNINADESQPLLKPKDPKRKARIALSCAIVLTTVFMVAEVIGGYYAHSLAIMTDAAHLLTDIGAMLLSLFAMWLASRPATKGMSFGFHRAEIIGALASVLTIWALTGILVYEAINRIIHPDADVNGKLMFFIATGGLGINIIDALILHAGSVEHSHGGHGHSHGHDHGHSDKKKKKSKEHDHEHGHEHKHKDKEHKKHKEGKEHKHGHDDHEGHEHAHNHSEHAHGDASLPLIKKDKHKKKASGHEETRNINVYAAFVHVIGDCVQSIGVMAASAVIWWRPQYKIADPIVTFIFSIIVLTTTVRLLRQSLAVLMEGVPQGIELSEVKSDLEEIPGVVAIHDLHVWSITVGQPALSVHLIISDMAVDTDATLRAAAHVLKDNYNISHTTIQIERVLECNTLANHQH